MTCRMLGEPHIQEPLRRLLAVILAVGAVGLCARLLPVVAALRDRQETSRWASTLRDVANLVAWAALLGAFLVAGLPLWAAVLAAGSAVVVLELARHFRGPSGGRQTLAFLLGLALTLPVTLFPVRATHGLEAVVVALFGG